MFDIVKRRPLAEDRWSMALIFAKLTPLGIAPSLGSEFSAGYDLASAYDYVLPARGKVLCATDIAIELPQGCYGRLAPRSGLACKHSIHVGAGVIDPDYRGPVKILLFNLEDEEYVIKRGERIAQLICEVIKFPDIVEQETLSATGRNQSGFGSTGK